MKNEFSTIGKAMSYIKQYVKNDFMKRKKRLTSNRCLDDSNRALAKSDCDWACYKKSDFHGYIFVSERGNMFYERENKKPDFDNIPFALSINFIYKFHISKPYGESAIMLEKVQL